MQSLPIRDKIAMYKRVFGTPEGAAVLADLTAQYDPDTIVGNDSNDTYFALGGRDVVKFILQRVENKNANKE